MGLMQVVSPTSQIDIINMRKELYVGYHPNFQVFYVSFKNIHDEIENVTIEKEMSWSSTWRFVNDKFEAFLDTKPTLSHLKAKFFHVWDGNHQLEVWLPYINQMHPIDETWHVCPTTWVLNVEIKNRRCLKTLMDNINM